MQQQKSQSTTFLESEGDAWFSRNHQHVSISPARKLLKDWCQPHCSSINHILEIGAGNGVPLSFLADQLDAKAVGFEPSGLAVENWQDLRKETLGGDRTSLSIGVASQLPFPDQSFDLVIFGFCLYLVDRPLLLRSLAEADRVLRDGGFLAIEDFDVPAPYANAYHHRQGLQSFKCDYSQVYLASGHYALAAKHSYSHAEFCFDQDIDKRVSLSLLYKQEDLAYSPRRP
jgi:ubiquinone/menaquinone biosynthesis C-methylase UbiE